MARDRPVLALDVEPLAAPHFAGISNVAKHMALQMLADESVEARFFFNRTRLPRALVEKLTQLDGCEILWWLVERLRQDDCGGEALDRRTIAIYPGHKWRRRLFPFEVQIVHDLTTILTPRFHTPSGVAFGQKHLFGDMASSDLLVSVSNSTAADVRRTFPELNHIPMLVSHLAACTTAVTSLGDGEAVEPYVVVLGTLEPRKSIEFVLAHLSANPRLAESWAFVFVGQSGWGPSIDELLQRHGLGGLVAAGRIRFTGFVSNPVRDHLVAYARAVVYASRYEGFGLPVLEALSYGTPVITTRVTSLPEVGGDVVTYFDIDAPGDFAAALSSVLEAAPSADAVETRKAWSKRFTWRKTYERIRDAAVDLEIKTRAVAT